MAGENWDRFLRGLAKIQGAVAPVGNAVNTFGENVMNDLKPGGTIDSWFSGGLQGNMTDPRTGQKVTSLSQAQAVKDYLDGQNQGSPGNVDTAVPAAADPAAASTAPNLNFTPLVNPLAYQLFFQTTIAPLMQGLQKTLIDQNNGLESQFANRMQNLHMPQSYKDFYATVAPQQAADQNNVLTAMMNAAATGPAIDQLMAQVNSARSEATRAYIENQLAKAAGGTGVGQGGIPAPAPKPAGT